MQKQSWSHGNPVSIRWGRGCRADLVPVLEQQRCLVVCSRGGRQRLEADPLLAKALANPRLVWVDDVQANPDLAALQHQMNENAQRNIEAVVAVGGGSVLDSAKALALALSPAAAGVPIRQLIANGPQYPWGTSLPLYALPTTAGTGSEVTPFATVWDHAAQRKLSLAGPAMFPRFAWVDPELTDGLALDVTLATGLDAINQAAESIWNKHMTPITEAFAQRALVLGFGALPRLLKDPADTLARDDMAQAGVLSGLAISQTRTALCHSMSYPLTAHFGVPHGWACAFNMPAVLRLNRSADDGRFQRLEDVLNQGQSVSVSLEDRFDQLHALMGVRDRVKAQVPALSALTALIPEMFTPGRADNNLAPIDAGVIEQVLVASWGATQPSA